jgi:hypothetical protein
MILLGLTVVATPQAHAAVDALVSGTVVDSATNQPLASVTVADSTSGRSVTTGVAGTYSLSIPAGDHVLTATLVDFVPSSSLKLSLTAGQVLKTQGFTMTQYASASGVVTEKGTTAGVSAVVLKFFDASTIDPNPLFAATTGPDGSWSIAHVAPGTYKVQFDGTDVGFYGNWYGDAASRDQASAISLAAGEKKDISGGVTRSPAGSSAPITAAGATVTAQGVGLSLSGHVTIDPGGTPASNATVIVTDRARTVVGYVGTDVGGAYSVSGLSAGYYVVAVEAAAADSGLVGYLGGAVSRALATYVWVDGVAALTGQDVHLQRTASISGTITDRGLPVAGAVAQVSGMGTGAASAKTAADGAFTIAGIPPGTYRLSAQLAYQVVWWNGAASINAGTDITLASGDALSGYTLALPIRYHLSGTLRSSSGVKLSNTVVPVTDGITRWTQSTDSKGVYSFSLPAGSYELGVFNPNGTVAWSPGQTSPDIIELSADTMRDVTQPPLLTVSLSVTMSDGSSPAYVSVGASNSHQEWIASADVTNGIALFTLPAGTYRFGVTYINVRPWSTQITVSASVQLPVTLDVGGRISGNVSASASGVMAMNVVTGQRVGQSMLNGRYSLGGLATGDYVVAGWPADSSSPSCGPASWLGGTSYLTARRLHVDSGTLLTGQDFTVDCEENWTPGTDLAGEIALPPSSPPDAATGVLVWATNTVGRVSTVPQADGTFAFAQLTPGTYDLSAFQSALGLEGHATVTIAPGVPTLTTLNLTRRGRVAGQVVGPHGEAVPASISNAETTATTDAQGNFSLGGISYGTHTLTVHPENELYALAFADVTVVAGSDVTGLIIHVALVGTMQGQLDPVVGSVEVTVTDSSGRVVACGYFTNSFSFTSLPPGLVRVRFSGSAIVTEWWRDSGDSASATLIQVPQGGGVTDITPNLSPAAAGEGVTAVTGKVSYASSPLAGVVISTLVGSVVVKTTTASDGTYSLSVPRGDTYSVRETCFGSITTACTGDGYADARSVVADRPTVTGVDFVVPQSADSFAVVYQPVVTGVPEVGKTLSVTVGPWSPTPDSVTWQWYADGYAIYGATGTSLTLADAQGGTQVQALVTVAKVGYATVTLPSAPVVVEAPGAIHALTPSRLLDSRTGQGGFTGPATNGTVIKLTVVGGTSGVPTDASAVLVNLTVTQPTASGYVTAYASGGTAPWVSNANFTPGVTVANLSLVPVGAVDGAIALKVATPGSVHVIADVQGYVVGGTVSAAGAVVPVTPARVLDTRTTQHVGTGGTISLTVAGVVGVPADASAVVANITVTGTTGPGYLTAWPAGVARPTSSNVNFVTGQTVPNMAIVKVGANKSISLFNSSGPMDMVVDIQGYVTAGTATLPGTVVPVTPSRMVDTRLDLGAYGPVPANSGEVVDFVAPDLTSIPQGALINLTVTEPQASGWLSAYPYGVARPLVSNLNFGPGMVVPNLSLATLGDGYGVLYNGSGGTVQMVADVLAYVL